MANSKKDAAHLGSESGYDFDDKSDGPTSGESDGLDGSPVSEATESEGTGSGRGGTSGGRGGGAKGAGTASEGYGSHGGQ